MDDVDYLFLLDVADRLGQWIFAGMLAAGAAVTFGLVITHGVI